MKTYKIYLITNNAKTTYNLYVGQTSKAIELRFREHINEALNPNRDRSHSLLHKAIAKYGPENFSIELIEDNIPEMLIDQKEQYYINYYDSYNNGYNETTGGQGIHGYKHTVETKEVLSQRSIKTWEDLRQDPEKLELRNSKISSALTGVPKSIEQKQKLSAFAASRTGDKNAFFGKHHSLETKMLISRVNSVAICAYDKQTNQLIKEFNSATEAMAWLKETGKTTNWNASMIIKCCKQLVKSAYGYIWRYKE